MSLPALTADHLEVLQEICNVAMGQAGAALARLLDSFVELTVPSAKLVSSGHIAEGVAQVVDYDGDISATRQAFYSHLDGEAFVVFPESGCSELADLLGYEEALGATRQDALLLDISNILVGACMTSLGEQLDEDSDVCFNPPKLACRGAQISTLFTDTAVPWEHALLLRVAFKLEARSFRSRILIFMPEPTLQYLSEALEQFLEDL